MLAFAIGGIVLLIYGVGQLMLAGFGLVFIGLSILLLLAANKIAKAIISLSKRFMLMIVGGLMIRSDFRTTSVLLFMSLR